MRVIKIKKHPQSEKDLEKQIFIAHAAAHINYNEPQKLVTVSSVQVSKYWRS